MVKVAEETELEGLDDPLAGAACPKCGSRQLKDSGKRHVFPNGDEAWVLECEECGFKDPQGHFKRTSRGMPRPRRSLTGH